ncbi:hypothetical protein Hbl1158_03640 [Halobaculum sp. CBA1158]|uniref:DUF7519 family protein n=1 Tax=Halobaculum sp. CBA1158 TaxID=2904243 RepID=UPI001F2AD994|nr:hypothetical protein [Halobaculum sp. CBA1158]UIP00467.1 hypothetical protein Hbl1158_03640 [Halobaculum sp. CBA1158]
MVAVTVTRKPPRLGVALAALPAAVGAAALGLASGAAAGVAAAGILLAGVGTLVGSRRTLGAGSAALAGGVFVAGGLAGAGAAPLLVGGLSAALTWDLGEHAIGLGEQLGRETDATRNLATHAAASIAVGAVAGAVAFGVYVAAAGGQPVVALVFLLVGAVALVSAVR